MSENSFIDIKDEEKIQFAGGNIVSFLPFLIFVLVAVTISMSSSLVSISK